MDLVLTIHSRLENLKSPGYKPCELHDDNESISRNFFRNKILVLIWDVVNGKMFKKFFFVKLVHLISTLIRSGTLRDKRLKLCCQIGKKCMINR